MSTKLQLNVESLIFAASNPISYKEIKATLADYTGVAPNDNDLEQAIESLIQKYQQDQFAIEVVEISEGFTFMSKGAYHNIISSYLKQITKKKLSKSALETLAIIAYRQPTTKADLESIRGVSCDYSIQKLLDKELVEVMGRSESVGKPILYGTSEKFMDYFGLKSIDDLPKLNDFELPDNSIGLPDTTTVQVEAPSREEE